MRHRTPTRPLPASTSGDSTVSGGPDGDGRRADGTGHPPPPLVFAGAVIFAVALAMLLPEPTTLSGPWRLLGLLPAGLGSGLHLRAWRTFRDRATTVRAQGAPRALVTDGPYARTRNPMYLSGILILLGLAVLLGSVAPLLVPVAYGALAGAIFLPAEERTMEARFGDAYREYRSTVPTWI